MSQPEQHMFIVKPGTYQCAESKQFWRLENRFLPVTDALNIFREATLTRDICLRREICANDCEILKLLEEVNPNSTKVIKPI